MAAPLGDGTDAAGEAAAYETKLKALAASHKVEMVGEAPRFDLVLLGMGSDGHVGSLYPKRAEPLATKVGLVVWCGAVCCGAAKCVVCCGAVLCCAVMQVRCGVVWRGMVQCGLVWLI